MSLSSPLLLRISPNTFAFIPILPMSLSSRNRSIFNTFRLILPRVSPICEGMHYHKTGVPWQMKSTFIIVLIYSFLPGNALFCKGFREFCEMLRNDESGKSEQNLASYYYLLVVKLVVKQKYLLLRDSSLDIYLL